MATEQTFTISGHDGSNTVVSGVTVPYTKSSDLEIYIGEGKVESIDIVDSGAGYTNRARGAAEKLIFSGGAGTAPDLWVTVGQDANNSGRIDGSIYGHATSGAALDNTNLNLGSGYTANPNVSLTNLDGGEGGQLTADIYAKKASGTDYTLSGTSGSATITFTSALANGVKVKVKRVTDVTTAVNTFNAGSSITAADLNKSFDQIRYKTQELSGITGSEITNATKGDIIVAGDTWTISNNAVNTAKIANDSVDGSKLTDNITIAGTFAATGASNINNTLGVAGNFSVNTNKFTVASSDGDTTIAGTLGVTGDVSLTADIDLNDEKKIKLGNSDDFTIYFTDSSSGQAYIETTSRPINIKSGSRINLSEGSDTLAVFGAIGGHIMYDHVVPDTNNTKDLGSSSSGWRDLYVERNVAINNNKFTIDTNGNTSIAGTLTTAATKAVTIGGPSIFSKVSSTLTGTSLAVTSTWHEIDANGNALTTLTGGTAGQTLLITITGSGDLVVTDNAIGAGANTIVGGVTLDVANGDTLLLMFDGTQWRKIAHGDN